MLDSVVRELNHLFADELKEARKCIYKTTEWRFPVGPMNLGEYFILPITTRKKVKSEGYVMQNCVRQYVDLCQEGVYLLFSIRSIAGDRVATLGVRRASGRWYLDDCLGKQNSIVMEKNVEVEGGDGVWELEIDYTELFSVAHEIVRLLNIADSEEGIL